MRASTVNRSDLSVVRNHAAAVLACDFFVTVTATLRTVCVFVVLDVGTRR
jgi:hypothetical protein